VAVMKDGRIEQIGTASSVYDSPESSFVAGFIGRQNSFAGTIASFDNAGVRVQTAGLSLYSSRPTRGSVPAASGAEVSAAIRPESVTVTSGPGPASDATVNSVTGTLLGVSELGHSLQLVVHTPSDDQILARLPRAANPPTELGSSVTCSWTADAVRIFTS
ncbi:MAG TPA: TOBE domain-containing protein, partial [Mycobacterium sp.]